LRRGAATPGLRPATLALAAALLALAGCSSVPLGSGLPAPSKAPLGKAGHTPAPGGTGLALPPAGSGRGGYYKDDGPGDDVPPGLEQVPDAQARIEPYSPRANRPYVVFGKTYMPITDNQPFSQRGIGSWYGKKFHGQKTSSGELYDMYKMTAAHPTLPIPSYARLTSIVSGRQVVVRINDRGPFHSNRAIDVSYTAALKLGLLDKGSHELLIERLLPADIERMQADAGRQSGVLGAGVASITAPTALPNWKMPPADGAPAKAAGAGGFYLQLGAFSQAANAEAARGRFEPHKVVLGMLEVVQNGAVFRLYGGPFQSRQAALDAARELPNAMIAKPIVIQR
jgi:rare lipoprotein A